MARKQPQLTMQNPTARAAIDRMNLREVAVDAQGLASLQSDLQQLSVANVEEANRLAVSRMGELAEAYGLVPSANDKPFAFSNGVAIIPVHGSLINRFSYSWGFVTGYNFLRNQVALAGLDPDVTTIVYDVNSCGGEAAGCFETARELVELANGKPTLAVVDSNCYSAAYAIGCSADKIAVIPSGGAGSVGVVAAHFSYAAMLDSFGVKVTLIHSGAHKVDGNPYEDLPANVKKDIQQGCDKSRRVFAEWVAERRGLTAEAVLATEARTYRADDAKRLGLIDAVATPSQALQAFLSPENPEVDEDDHESPGSDQPLEQENAMSQTTKPADNVQAGPQPTASAPAVVPVAAAPAVAQAPTADVAQARSDERARISGIQSCEEAKGREALASHLALNTEMSVEAAKGILAASPIATPAAAAPAAPAKAEGNPFKAAMDSGAHPNVGADHADASSGEMTVAQRVLAAQSAAVGKQA